MRKLPPAHLRALKLVADGQIYRTRPEEFHQAAPGYEPRTLWRSKCSPHPLRAHVIEGLIDNGLISLDDSHTAVLMPEGTRILEEQRG